MVAKICLDSDVLIEILKNDNETIAKFKQLDSEFYATSINVFEIWSGKKEEELINHFLKNFIIIDFDEESAFLAGDIRRELKKKGEDVEMRDIFIASICISNDLELWTYNRKHFERMVKFGLKLSNF